MKATAVLALALAASCALGCDRGGPPVDEKAAAMRAQLVGTWRETGGQSREYVLDRSGTFTMKLGGCPDAAPAPASTASGAWSVSGGSLVLEVKSSGDPLLARATMIDAVRELGATTLVLHSSVFGCAGQEVRLTRATGQETRP